MNMKKKVMTVVVSGLAIAGFVAATTLALPQISAAQTETPPAAGQAAVLDKALSDRMGRGGPIENHDQYLADALGITQDELTAARTKAREAAIAQAVKDGLITQEQADQITAERALQKYISDNGLFKKAVESAVSAGVITQAQADTILSKVPHSRFGFGFDGLGELAVSFNQMSTDLARANELRRQMMADVAHELRTPLTVMAGYVGALRDGVLKPTPDRFEAMSLEAQQLQRLIDDLRTLSLAEAGELPLTRQVTAPCTLLERVAAAFGPRAERAHITLRLAADENMPGLNADPERLVQVLENLVGNAMRHTDAGGEIVLSARSAEGCVLLAVRDNGRGIPPDVLPHVFDRFYRGDGARDDGAGESGLGLAIARSIVEAHGGSITASSSGVGQGATFTIRLPAD